MFGTPNMKPTRRLISVVAAAAVAPPPAPAPAVAAVAAAAEDADGATDLRLPQRGGEPQQDRHAPAADREAGEAHGEGAAAGGREPAGAVEAHPRAREVGRPAQRGAAPRDERDPDAGAAGPRPLRRHRGQRRAAR